MVSNNSQERTAWQQRRRILVEAEELPGRSPQDGAAEGGALNARGHKGSAPIVILAVANPCPFCSVPSNRIWIHSEHAIAFAADAPAADGHRVTNLVSLTQRGHRLRPV